MRPISSSYLVVAVFALIVAVWFGSLTFSKRWVYAAWVKLAFRVFAIATVISFGLKLLLAYRAFPWAIFWALYTQQIFFFGVAGCTLFLFFFSGEALSGYRRWRALRLKERSLRTIPPKA